MSSQMLEAGGATHMAGCAPQEADVAGVVAGGAVASTPASTAGAGSGDQSLSSSSLDT
jgi:hypothetical protein